MPTSEVKRRYYLQHLYFYLTEGCNLACRHCWLAPKFDPGANKYPTLPLELFATAIREAKPLGLKRVKLTGGEPLLHPNFLDILRIVRREELALCIESNGVLCTPELAAEIARFPRCGISISIDGADAATHEWVRGVKGSFALAQKAVRDLAAARVAPEIIMSVMRCNVDQVEALVRMAEQLGAREVKFNVVQPTGRGEKFQNAGDALSIGEMIELGRHVEMDLAPASRVRLFFDYPMAFRPLSRIASGNACSICGILGVLGVIATGHYALCGIGTHIPELVFGRVGQDSLERVWQEQPRLNELREGLPQRLGGVCAQCLMRSRCLGSCIAQNYYRSGSFWAPFWFCEEAEKAGLFPESRLADKSVSAVKWMKLYRY